VRKERGVRKRALVEVEVIRGALVISESWCGIWYDEIALIAWDVVVNTRLMLSK
jgi:hypothetical protein